MVLFKLPISNLASSCTLEKKLTGTRDVPIVIKIGCERFSLSVHRPWFSLNSCTSGFVPLLGWLVHIGWSGTSLSPCRIQSSSVMRRAKTCEQSPETLKIYNKNSLNFFEHKRKKSTLKMWKPFFVHGKKSTMGIPS